jgi:hypothetical protein
VDQWRLLSSVSFRFRYLQLGLAFALVIVCFWIGYGVLAKQNGPSVACATNDGAYLSEKDLGALDSFVDVTYSAPPFHGQLGSSSSQLYVNDFRSGRTRGFVAAIAVSGPYRQSVDEQARSLGYPIGKWPLVPLFGPVVRDNRGLLEVYQTNFTFASVAGSQSYISYLRTSMASDPQAVEMHPLHIRGAVFAYVSLLGPNDGQHERAFHVAVQEGQAVMNFAFQGGADLSLTSVEPFVVKGIDHTHKTCPSIHH